jgi:glycerol-3-phosphate dehydrogenase
MRSRKEVTSNPQLSDDELSYFIEDLNSAIPSLKLKKNEILHIFCGYLPVTQEGSTHLTRNDIILDHQQHNGPKGLFSVSGVKYTASRLVAEKVLRNIFPHQKVLPDIKSQAFISADNGQKIRGIFEYHWLPAQSNSHWREEMLNIIREESVQHLDDLILRRTNLGDNPVRALQIAPLISELFEWDEVRSRTEIFRLREHFKHNQYIEYNLP